MIASRFLAHDRIARVPVATSQLLDLVIIKRPAFSLPTLHPAPCTLVPVLVPVPVPDTLKRHCRGTAESVRSMQKNLD